MPYSADHGKIYTRNIHEAQGFYFSRPIPAAIFIAYHREAPHC